MSLIDLEESKYYKKKEEISNLKSEIKVGDWVTSLEWAQDSYCKVTGINKYDISFNTSFIGKKLSLICNEWISDQTTTKVSIEEVIEIAKEYGHKLSDLGLDITKESLYGTKIWIGDDDNLRKLVMERIVSLGFFSYFDDETRKKFRNLCIYPNGSIFYLNDETVSKFDTIKDLREITIDDLYISNQKTDNNKISDSILNKETEKKLVKSLSDLLFIPHVEAIFKEVSVKLELSKHKQINY